MRRGLVEKRDKKAREGELLLIVTAGIWLMPLDFLHMTTLEITHSLTEEGIETLVDKLRPTIPSVSTSMTESSINVLPATPVSHCEACQNTIRKYDLKRRVDSR